MPTSPRQGKWTKFAACGMRNRKNSVILGQACKTEGEKIE